MKIYFPVIFFLLASAGPTPAGQNTLFVEAMHTENRATAESAQNRLKRFGNAHISRQGDRYTVLIGPIGDSKEAVSVRNIVRRTHPDALIRTSASVPSKNGTPSAAPASEPKTIAPVGVVKPTAPASEPKSIGPVGVVKPAPPVLTAVSPDKQPPQPVETNPPAPESTGLTSSPETLLKRALDDYQARRYESALQWLSLYLSLYPVDDNVPLAMFAVAGIQLAMKRPLSALRIYSHILERHAETPEAVESMIALADMSLLYPGLKPSIALSGAQWYLDPVMAYDQALSKNPPEEITERVLLQRISALRLKGRYREAYDAGHRFLERYPRTNHQYVLLAALRSDVENVIEERIAAGDDLAVISMVSHASRKDVIKMNDTDILIKAAGSYGRLGMTHEARRLLSATRPFAMSRISRIDAALEALSKTETPPAAASPEMERWRLYEAGRRQIHTSTRSEAEKTLAQMKGTPQDAFWSKLAEFALNDGPWSIKYKDYLK